eukprot:13994497-Alexandrium_andersonii.AAC.1
MKGATCAVVRANPTAAMKNASGRAGGASRGGSRPRSLSLPGVSLEHQRPVARSTSMKTHLLRGERRRMLDSGPVAAAVLRRGS